MVIRDKEKIKKIATTLGLKMTPREFSHTDRSVQLSAIFTQWLPLAGAVLKMVVHHLPGPLELSEERAEKLMSSGGLTFSCLPAATQALKKGTCVFNITGKYCLIRIQLLTAFFYKTKHAMTLIFGTQSHII